MSIPAAAVEAGAKGYYDFCCRNDGEESRYETLPNKEFPRSRARAVLMAASREIACPRCEGEGRYAIPPHTVTGGPLPSRRCEPCGGSGVLYVLIHQEGKER